MNPGSLGAFCRFWTFCICVICSTAVRCALPVQAGERPLPPAPVAAEAPLENEATQEQTASLTLEQAVQIALSHHPSLSEQRASIDRARGLRWDATRKPNPQFGYMGSEIGDDGRGGLQGFYFSREYITANKLGLNDQVGGWEVETENWRWQVQRLRVSGNVQQRFYEVLAAKRQIQILRTMELVLSDGVALTQRLVEAGEIGQGQLLQAQFQLKQNQLQLRNAEHQYRATQQSLAIAMGLNDLSGSELEGGLTSALPEFEADSLLQHLLATHPLLESARAEMVRHQWQIQRERAEPIPNVQSIVGMQHNMATDEALLNLQLGVVLPVNNRNQGRIAAACAQYAQASHQVKRLELQVRNRFIDAYRDYTVARQTLHDVEQELLPLSQESLRSIQALFRAGEVSYVALIQAQQSYVDTLLALNAAQLQAWRTIALFENGLLNEALTIE